MKHFSFYSSLLVEPLIIFYSMLFSYSRLLLSMLCCCCSVIYYVKYVQNVLYNTFEKLGAAGGAAALHSNF